MFVGGLLSMSHSGHVPSGFHCPFVVCVRANKNSFVKEIWLLPMGIR